MRKILTFCLIAISVTGCAGTPPPRPSAELTVVADQASLPAPSREDLTAADRPALIGPLDTIEVSVFNVPELTQEMQVDASGRISMPLIGTIDARGKTAGELARSIEDALRGKYVKNPEATVNIKSSVSQVVTVDGEVRDPGLYPVTNQMTLMRVIASARGVSEFAREEHVVILRTVNNQRMAGLYDLSAIRRGAYTDPPIYANDVVMVGNSPARRLFRDLIATAPLVVAPLVAILR